jgi:hypothetical protein
MMKNAPGSEQAPTEKRKKYEKPVLIMLSLDGDSTMGKNPAMNEFTNGFGAYGASLS